jgi:membrane associated rhomboid family serine protease
MIPLCDAVPSRTRPVVVWGLIGASILASAIARLAGVDSPWLMSRSWGAALSLIAWTRSLELALVVVALWLFGPTVEDRLGHDRFSVLWLLAGGTAATAGLAATPADFATPMLAGTGAAAGIVGANLALHPKGRMLGAMPVFIGFEFVDVPAWAYALAWTAAAFVLTFAPPALVAASLAAGIGAGALGSLVLRRPERMRVAWWGQ